MDIKNKTHLVIHKHFNIPHLKNLQGLPDGPLRKMTAWFSLPVLNALVQLCQDVNDTAQDEYIQPYGKAYLNNCIF